MPKSDIKTLSLIAQYLHVQKEILFPASAISSTGHFETHLPEFMEQIGPHRNSSMMSDERTMGQMIRTCHSGKGYEMGLTNVYIHRDFVGFVSTFNFLIFLSVYSASSFLSNLTEHTILRVASWKSVTLLSSASWTSPPKTARWKSSMTQAVSGPWSGWKLLMFPSWPPFMRPLQSMSASRLRCWNMQVSG